MGGGHAREHSRSPQKGSRACTFRRSHRSRAFRFQTGGAFVRQGVPSAFLGLRQRAMRSPASGDGICCPAMATEHLGEGRQTCTTVGSARRLAPEGYLSHVRNGGLGGLAWSRPSLRCTIGRDSLGLRSMTLVVVSIYLAAVLFCVGTTAWILRAWTRRRYWHKSPSDLHYVVAGTALLLSAGIGVA